MKDLHEDSMFESVRERMKSYQEAPSDELWERIAQRSRRDVPVPMWPLWLESSSLGAMVVMFLIAMSFGSKEEAVEAGADVVKEEVTVLRDVTTERVNPQSPMTNIQSQITNSLHQTLNIRPQTSDSSNQTSNIKLQTSDSSNQTSDSTLQTTIPPYKKPRSKFQIYISVTPSLSFQKMLPAHDQIIVEGFEHRSPLSIKRFGFGIDAGFQRNINNLFGYYGGVSFYRQQQELTYQYFDRDANVNRIGDSWSFEIDRPQHTSTFIYNMTNIGLRSGILVTLKGEKLQHKFGAGLVYSHGLLKSNDSYNNSKSSYLSYQLFYRNEVKINERFSWFVEPTFIYSFLSKEKLDEPFKLKPYRAGIGGGVLYRFN